MSTDPKDRIDPLVAKQQLQSWFDRRSPAAVTMAAVGEPSNDPSDAYAVAYEARFSPASLRQAHVEVWITKDGFTAFGFERRSRLGLRVSAPVRFDMFAAGIEPVPMSHAHLNFLLDLAADGRIALAVLTLPVLGIITTRAIVAPGTKMNAGLTSKNFSWLVERAPHGREFWQHVAYDPW